MCLLGPAGGGAGVTGPEHKSWAIITRANAALKTRSSALGTFSKSQNLGIP